MPIEYAFKTKPISEDDFHKLDYKVMGLVFSIEDKYWQDLDEDSVWLKRLVLDLLNEWGAFLDTSLFYDAIKYFLGGEDNVVKTIELSNGNYFMGNQKVHLLNSKIILQISSMTKDEKFYEHHLRRFLYYTSLNTIQWINFNHDRIIFKTINR